MGKHSKHQNSAPIYTYHERVNQGSWGHNPLARLASSWGTHKQRVEGDNVKPFDHCSLCLHPVVNPMTCTKGHLYCKECIFQSLLEQKKKIERQLKQYDQQQKEIEAEEQTKESEKKAKELAQFDKSVVGFTAGRGKESKEKPKVKLTSYWVPGVREDDAKEIVKKPDTTTVCPDGNHPLRLKQLVSVNFTLIENATIGPTESGRYMCPVCNKTLINSLKLICLADCGHVMCAGCHDKTKDEKACIVCAKPFREKDVIKLESPGTSFASSLGEKATAKKQDVVQMV
eukprot:TRINITY_DN570_c1_g1_i1.p1 TRINITY_DN570_c1_g1~~TRINITY_DN570_c1_g1_i1.p1  ORF type:complete len:286 (-),score=108.03 TRINITY_DN570_c1_g1_i1:337-1194(-)